MPTLRSTNELDGGEGLRLPDGVRVDIDSFALKTKLDRPAETINALIEKINYWAQDEIGTPMAVANKNTQLGDDYIYDATLTVGLDKEAWAWVTMTRRSRKEYRVKIRSLVREPETNEQRERWGDTDQRKRSAKQKARDLANYLQDDGATWWWPFSDGDEFYTVIE